MIYDGIIELTDDPALNVLGAFSARVTPEAMRLNNVLMEGTPDGIRTHDLHLERVPGELAGRAAAASVAHRFNLLRMCSHGGRRTR